MTHLSERTPDLVERPASLLHCLDSKELLEVAGAVVIAPGRSSTGAR